MDVSDLGVCLPLAVWTALQTISDHLASQPLTEFERASLKRGLETLAEKLIMLSKHHNITYPMGD